MYIIFIIIALFTFMLGFRSKKKLNRNKKLKEILNEKLSKLHYRKDSKNYNNLKIKIINSGIDVSPETFQTVTLLLPIFTMMSYIALKIINYMNLRVNEKALMDAAKVLNNEAILNVSLNVNALSIALVGFITLLIPDLLLRLMGKIRAGGIKREALMLQTYTIMLLKTTRPVKQILISLQERADYFKTQLKIVNEKFSTNPDAALSELKRSASQGDFTNICVAMQQALSGDRSLSVIYLENHRKLAREVNRQIRIRNQTRNQAIGIFIMAIPTLACIAVVGYPWLMYVVRAIKSIPI